MKIAEVIQERQQAVEAGLDQAAPAPARVQGPGGAPGRAGEQSAADGPAGRAGQPAAAGPGDGAAREGTGLAGAAARLTPAERERALNALAKVQAQFQESHDGGYAAGAAYNPARTTGDGQPGRMTGPAQQLAVNTAARRALLDERAALVAEQAGLAAAPGGPDGPAAAERLGQVTGRLAEIRGELRALAAREARHHVGLAKVQGEPRVSLAPGPAADKAGVITELRRVADTRGVLLRERARLDRLAEIPGQLQGLAAAKDQLAAAAASATARPETARPETARPEPGAAAARDALLKDLREAELAHDRLLREQARLAAGPFGAARELHPANTGSAAAVHARLEALNAREGALLARARQEEAWASTESLRAAGERAAEVTAEIRAAEARLKDVVAASPELAASLARRLDARLSDLAAEETRALAAAITAEREQIASDRQWLNNAAGPAGAGPQTHAGPQLPGAGARAQYYRAATELHRLITLHERLRASAVSHLQAVVDPARQPLPSWALPPQPRPAAQPATSGFAAGTGKSVLTADQQAIVAGNDVISGELAVDERGKPVQPYGQLGLTLEPGGPAPAEPVAFASDEGLPDRWEYLSGGLAVPVGARAEKGASIVPPPTRLDAPPEAGLRVPPTRPPEPEPEHAGTVYPPDRIRHEGRLAASDTVSTIRGGAAAWETLQEQLRPGLGVRWEAVAEVLRPMFDTASIKPLLTALARGQEREVPVVTGGSHKNSVILDAALIGDSFVHHKDVPGVEFEGGAESQFGTGSFQEERWRLIGGLSVKAQDEKSFQYSGTPGQYRDSVRRQTAEDTGRTVSKSKTVEEGAIFNGLIELGFQMPSTGGREPRDRHAARIAVRVVVPRADARDAEGNLPPVQEHHAAPPRITTAGRFGSTDVVLDLNLLAAAPEHRRQGRSAGAEEITAAGTEVFGRDWPQVAGAISSQLRLTKLHQRMKGMMSGQPLYIHMGAVPGEVEVTARVVRMEHRRGTAQTEFNTGTEVLRRTSVEHTTTTAWQIPTPGQFLAPVTEQILAVSATSERGRDHMQGDHELSRSGMLTKAKGRGEVFNAVVTLEFNMSFTPNEGPERRMSAAGLPLAAKVIVEREEAVLVASHDATIWDADAPAGEAPEPGSQLRDIALPPDRVWSEVPGEGLKDTDVVRDLYGMENVRAALAVNLTALLGSANWEKVRWPIINAFSRDLIASHLPAMTRKILLPGPDLAQRGLPAGVEVEATANISSLTFRRYAKPELAPQRDVGSQLSERRFSWWNSQVLGLPGGAVDLVAIGLGQGTARRRRTGWQNKLGGKTVTNAKFPAKQAIYDGTALLSFTASAGGKSTPFVVEVPFEVAIPAGETATLSAAGLTAWRSVSGADAPVTRMDYQQLRASNLKEISGPAGYLSALPSTGQKKQLLPPRRVSEGRLSRSDLVLSIYPDSNQLVQGASAVLQPVLGRGWKRAERRIRNRLDSDAIKPRIPGLTSGDVIKVPVSGKGWSGHVRVTAVARAMSYKETIPKTEFENGTQDQSTVGSSVEKIRRAIDAIRLKLKFPHASMSISATRNRDSTTSIITQSAGGTVAKGKTVEDGSLLTGELDFLVSYDLRRLGRRFTAPPGSGTVSVPFRVVVPERDMRRASAGTTVDQPPVAWFALPERIRRQLALSSSDIVQDLAVPVKAGPAGQPRHGDMADIMTNARLDEKGPQVFGWGWSAMRDKVLAEVNLQKIHEQLRAMTAGNAIVVDAPAGATGRVLITARVGAASHVGNTPQTEFNTGTQRSGGMKIADTRENGNEAESGILAVQALGTTDPLGVSPVAVQGGANVTGGAGADAFEYMATSAKTALTMKTKVAGAVFEGAVVLEFRLESRPFLRKERTRRGEAPADVRFLSEQAESVAVKSKDETVFTGVALPARQPGALHSGTPVAPPGRVWDTPAAGGGLLDTDVVRGLPSIGGLHQAVHIEGKRFFGASAWKLIGSAARRGLSHAQLSAALPGMTRGKALLAPVALGRLLAPNAQITAQARILRMHYVRTDGKAEVNPVNEISEQSSQVSRYWWLGGLTAQAGVKIGPATADVVVGGQYRHRVAAIRHTGGRTVNNAKVPSPTAIYESYVLVTITLRNGSRTRDISGVIPAEIGIELTETTTARAGVSIFYAPGETTVPRRTEGQAMPLGAEEQAVPLGAEEQAVPLGAEEQAVPGTERWAAKVRQGKVRRRPDAHADRDQDLLEVARLKELRDREMAILSEAGSSAAGSARKGRLDLATDRVAQVDAQIDALNRRLGAQGSSR